MSRTAIRWRSATDASPVSSRGSRCSGGARWTSSSSPRSRRSARAGSGSTPSRQHRFAIASLEEAPDWNISRQIWWGHQLPLWECPDGHVTVEETEPEACVECGSHELTRSTDVLDTWFSSALWPFATLGWPDDTEDLRTFYPGDMNTTARDIIRLWENRMIFAGLELLGEVPFRDVVIHSTVHAPAGRPDVQEPRHRHEPARGNRALRRRRDALRAPEDGVVAGRPLRRRGDRGGAEAREQALERRPADPPTRRRRVARPTRSRGARGALDPGATAPDAARRRGRLRLVQLRPRRRRPLPPHIRRLLRLVCGEHEGAALCRGRGGSGDRAVRARVPAPHPPSRAAACHGGDLVAVP